MSARNYPPGAMVRASEIYRNPRTGSAGLLPISKVTWYVWIKSGRIPPGRRIGAATVVWPLELILSLGTAD